MFCKKKYIFAYAATKSCHLFIHFRCKSKNFVSSSPLPSPILHPLLRLPPGQQLIRIFERNKKNRMGEVVKFYITMHVDDCSL